MSSRPNQAVLPDRTDVQGLVFYGYRDLDHAAYCLFHIDEREHFQGWLGGVLDSGQITRANWKEANAGSDGGAGTRETPKLKDALNIAFTARGLRRVLGKGWVEESYDVPFVEGMVTEHRSRLLGDVEHNDPHNWEWGQDGTFDGLLIVFGTTRPEVVRRVGHIFGSSGMSQVGNPIFGALDPETPHHTGSLRGREPFGFVDGISQPVIIGTDRHRRLVRDGSREAELQGVPAGEMVFGYPDGTDPDWDNFEGTEALPRTPATTAGNDPNGILADHPEWPRLKDLGKNGTYMVVRQLRQDVAGFWDHLEKSAVKFGTTVEALGAKVIGRGKDGESLEWEPKSDKNTNNLFDYSDDPVGLCCPFGSHIRRSNPRASGEEGERKIKNALKVVNRHRILRRGRIYTGPEGNAEGLLFLCLNTSINRQFEFVQSTWCNNQFFHGLEREVDPIVGTVRDLSDGTGKSDRFTIPRDPYRQILNGLDFVRVLGGAYFFLPGLTGLRCIADAPGLIE